MGEVQHEQETKTEVENVILLRIARSNLSKSSLYDIWHGAILGIFHIEITCTFNLNVQVIKFLV